MCSSTTIATLRRYWFASSGSLAAIAAIAVSYVARGGVRPRGPHQALPPAWKRLPGRRLTASRKHGPAVLAPLQADDIARNIVTVVTQPAHVSINEVLVRPTDRVRKFRAAVIHLHASRPLRWDDPSVMLDSWRGDDDF